MKLFYRSVIFAALILFSTANAQSSKNNFSFSPEKPSAHQKVTVKYDASGTNLNGAAEMKFTAAFYSTDLDNTETYIMSKNGSMWTGEFTVPEKSKGVFIWFSDGDVKDINNKLGYVIYFHDGNGNLLPGCYAGLADGYASWLGMFEFDTNYDLAAEYFKKEFSVHPELKPDYFVSFIISLAASLGTDSKDVILKEMDELRTNPNLPESVLSFMSTRYDRLQRKDDAEKVKAEMLAKYPNGETVQGQKYSEYRKLKSPEDKINFIGEFKKSFPGSRYIEAMQNDLIRTYTQSGEFDKALSLIKSGENTSPANYDYLAKSVNDKGKTEEAVNIVKQGIELAEKELSNPASEKTSYMTSEEWLNQRKTTLGGLLSTYASILESAGKQAEALNALQKAVDLQQGKEKDVNESFASLLIKTGQYEKAKGMLGKFISDGTGTPAMKDLLKEAYLKTGGVDAGFGKYYDDLYAVAKKKIVAKLSAEMINEPAPQFSLSDLDGKEVSLASLKCKTVIVDFWATWCPPCLASFPGMKIAVEQHSSDPDVEFLFVDTWERVDNKKENAIEFIKKNNYPFHVLQDNENSVVSMFKVSGIPTKFIIDKAGNIRFKSVGFGGDINQLAEELGIIIEMLK